MGEPIQPQTVEELRQAQAEEYGTYVATTPIYVGTALAFNEGDPVPASSVKSGAVSKDQVQSVKQSAKS